MQRHDVVAGVTDAGGGERVAEFVALGAARAEEVVDVAGLVLGQLEQLAQAQLGVARSRLAALLVPAIDLAQEDAQEGRL